MYSYLSRYGGGPSPPRTVITADGSNELELYPVTIRVNKVGDDGKAFQFKNMSMNPERLKPDRRARPF